MDTFSELLTAHMERAGIGDSELARRIPVSRPTLIRWREGVTARPRYREDVVRCAEVLRLTPDETRAFLSAAGFAPDDESGAGAAPDADEGGESETADGAASTSSAAESAGAGGLASAAESSAGAANVAVSPVSESGGGAASFPSPTAAAMGYWQEKLGARGLVVLGLAVVAAVVALAAAAAYVGTRRAADYPAALEGETLIAVAPFVNYTAGGQGFNVTGRLMAALDEELAAAGLGDARTVELPRAIGSEEEARAAAERSRAALVIWGEYDSGRALARFETARGVSESRGGRVVDIASSPSELPAVINEGLTEETRRAALAALGGLYLERGEHDRAKSALARALRLERSEDPAALANLRFLLGRAYQGGALADQDEAIWLFTQALEAEPRSVETLNARAVSYLDRGREGDADRAVADLARAAAIAPERARTLVNLGVAYGERGADGDSEAALDAFSEALSLEPDYAAALVNRAAAYSERGADGDARRAMDDLERAIALDGGLASAYLNRGIAFLERGGDGDDELAMSDFNRAVSLDGESAAAAYNRALLRSKMGDLDGSLSDLRRASELAPRRTDFAVTLCWQLAAAGAAREALHRCARMAADGAARDALGLANALVGRRTRAAEHFEAFLEWTDSRGADCREAHESSRRGWIETLRAGGDPFDGGTLWELRVRPGKPGDSPC